MANLNDRLAEAASRRAQRAVLAEAAGGLVLWALGLVGVPVAIWMVFG